MTRSTWRTGLLALTLGAIVLGGASPGGAAGVPRAECFPVERLPADLRPEAERLLLRALDSEALYTIVGGLKPISSSFYSARISVDQPDWTETERIRQILSVFRSGDEISASLQPFWRVFEDRRSLDAFVFHRDSVRTTVAAHPGVFAFWGVSPSSDPVQVLMALEVDGTPRRSTAYGLLFGYPRHAVDFFVASEWSQRRTGKFVERDFLHIPVFERPTNRFVYAVPKGHQPNAADEELKRRAAPILAMYREMRSQYIGDGKPGVVQLLRDWFDDGTGRCSPATALRKAQAAARR